MQRRSVKLVNALLVCPACESREVRDIVPESAGDDASRCMVLCARCELWRGVEVRHWEAWTIERRLRRRVGRDLGRTARHAVARSPEGV